MALWPAIAAGLVIPTREGYQAGLPPTEGGGEGEEATDATKLGGELPPALLANMKGKSKDSKEESKEEEEKESPAVEACECETKEASLSSLRVALSNINV